MNARTPQDVAIAGRALAWLTVMAALAWYAAKLPSSSDAALAAAVAVGLGVGFRITRRWVALAVLPLIAFSVAGLVLSTQFSNTHASGGGDRSDAAQVAALGVWCGVVATGVLAVTWLGRAGLLKIAGRILRRA